MVIIYFWNIFEMMSRICVKNRYWELCFIVLMFWFRETDIAIEFLEIWKACQVCKTCWRPWSPSKVKHSKNCINQREKEIFKPKMAMADKTWLMYDKEKKT